MGEQVRKPGDLLTEDEARTKWCPMVRYALNPVSCRCIASDCMMWRLGFYVGGLPGTGFCGLAGVGRIGSS